MVTAGERMSRATVRWHLRELSRRFDHWDPIGVYADEDRPPPGEYDCLLPATFRRLRESATPEVIAGSLATGLVEHFGLTPTDPPLAFAEDLRRWWDDGTAAGGPRVHGGAAGPDNRRPARPGELAKGGRRDAGSAGFAELARLLGVKVDARDEHQRWDAYQQALADPDLEEHLLAATADEPDGAIAVGVVFAMLERLDPDACGPWIRAVPASHRHLVVDRADDLAVLRAGTPSDAGVPGRDVDTWSDWLQRRLVDATASRDVLALLEARGRTRRVRGRARHRLRNPTPDG